MATKIENYETWKAAISADTFTFTSPENPSSMDSQVDSNHQVYNLDFSDHHYLVAASGHSPVSFILQGFFYGTNRWTNYRKLSAHIHDTKNLKKLYFESDKFAIVVGKQIKRTNTGGRTNFVDYVATLESPFGILFGNTLNDNSGGADTNDGDVTTFIEKITGTYDGSGDIVIEDDFGNKVTIQAADVSASDEITIRLVSMQDIGSNQYGTTFSYCYNDTTSTEINPITDGQGVIKLASGASTTTISISNLTSSTIYFRDGWSV